MCPSQNNFLDPPLCGAVSHRKCPGSKCPGFSSITALVSKCLEIGAEVSQSVLMPKCLVAEVSGNRHCYYQYWHCNIQNGDAAKRWGVMISFTILLSSWKWKLEWFNCLLPLQYNMSPLVVEQELEREREPALPDIRRVTSLKMLGVTITNHMSASEHVSDVIIIIIILLFI